MTNQAHAKNSSFRRPSPKNFHRQGSVIGRRCAPVCVRELLVFDIPATSVASTEKSTQFSGEAF